MKEEIEIELKKVDNFFFFFNLNFVIICVNYNEKMEVDSFFVYVFYFLKKIFDEIYGVFDIIVVFLVNVWGFGFKKFIGVDLLIVDSLC